MNRLILLISFLLIAASTFSNELAADIYHQDGCIIYDSTEFVRLKTQQDSVIWVNLSYNRFEVYIDSVYYFNNTPAIDIFFDKFEPRLDLLESTTRWNSEESFGIKLRINVTAAPFGACSGGQVFIDSEGPYVVLKFSDPFYSESPINCSLP